MQFGKRLWQRFGFLTRPAFPHRKFTVGSYQINYPGRMTSLWHHMMSDGNGAKNFVGYWALGTSGLVFGLVVLGGLTRLTESGLSMVDWKLIHFKAPSTESQWQAYFEKYQQFPEYQLNNRGMTLEEFKRIYWMEHAHRVYGRCLGLTIILPSVIFAIKGLANKRTSKVLFGLCGLVGFQGLLGWYMVKSGLKQEILENKEPARVSQYRLAAHLGSAFALYLGLVNTGLRIILPASNTPLLAGTPLRKMKFLATGMTHLVLTTALAGAFVAGLDAGMIYNTFPKMGNNYIPDDFWDKKLGWRNIFDNPACAQFIHRCLAYSSVAWASGLWVYSRKVSLPRNIRLLSNVLFVTIWAQGSLGLLTLLYCVPIPLASAHQAGSLVVLTSSAVLLKSIKNTVT